MDLLSSSNDQHLGRYTIPAARSLPQERKQNQLAVSVMPHPKLPQKRNCLQSIRPSGWVLYLGSLGIIFILWFYRNNATKSSSSYVFDSAGDIYDDVLANLLQPSPGPISGMQPCTGVGTSWMLVQDETIRMAVGRLVLWKPPCQETTLPSRAILFVAHGCGHSGTDWFTEEECPAQDLGCLGLPEERAIVQLAIDRNLLVVAMSASDEQSHCWSGRDGKAVAMALQEIQQRHKLPVLAFGASSGGSFVSRILPQHVPQLAGFIAQIAPAPPPAHATAQSLYKSVYISMQRDRRTDQSIQAYLDRLSPTDRRETVRHIRLDPLTLDTQFFGQRLHGQYTTTQSARMVQALASTTLLTADAAAAWQVQRDPRLHSEEWKSALRTLPFVNDSLVPDQSPIAEVLNVAWGMHEMTRDGVAEGLDFLLEGL